MNETYGFSESFNVEGQEHVLLRGSTRSVGIRVRTQSGIREVICRVSSNFANAEELRDKFRFWQEEEAILFSGDLNRMFFAGRNRWIRLEFIVPDKTGVMVESSSGSVRLEGIYGRVEAKSTSGSVRLDYAEQALLSTASGSVKVNKAQVINAKSTSGSVEVQSVSKHCELEAGSGSVRVEELRGDGALVAGSGSVKVGTMDGSFELRSGSGSVKVASLYQGSLRVKTGSGSQRIGVATGTAVLVDAGARSGSVRSSLQNADPSSSDRTAEVYARAGSGSIRFTRA